ncbi:MAG: MBL fold metallo-hydrolase [Chitinophagaceae bacterium]|nr:MAG: MBL fold metallo-hydrolase [Chitinophagaceae bacterium]
MKIIPLSEGAFSIDQTKVFVPFNKAVDDIQQRPAGSLLVEVQPFVVVTSTDIILLDAGLGFTNADGILQIHENLAKEGISATDVTKVLMSHLHKDHSGGVANNQTIAFPNATYYVNRQEMEFSLEKGKLSYVVDDIAILQNAPQVEFIEGNGNIGSQVRYETTGAHSPYHMAFWIEEAGQVIFFGADVAPQLQQMKSRFVAKYDYDGKKCMELRSQWWQQGQEEHWTMLFYHDIKTPFIAL